MVVGEELATEEISLFFEFCVAVRRRRNLEFKLPIFLSLVFLQKTKMKPQLDGNIFISRKIVQNWIGELSEYALLKAFRAAHFKLCEFKSCWLP